MRDSPTRAGNDASSTGSSCIWIDFTTASAPDGSMATSWYLRTDPDSTRPRATVPTPLTSKQWSIATRVGPAPAPSLSPPGPSGLSASAASRSPSGPALAYPSMTVPRTSSSRRPSSTPYEWPSTPPRMPSTSSATACSPVNLSSDATWNTAYSDMRTAWSSGCILSGKPPGATYVRRTPPPLRSYRTRSLAVPLFPSCAATAWSPRTAAFTESVPRPGRAAI